MADLILFTFFVLVFAGGVWCGKTYGSIDDMIQRIKKSFKD
jgi:hypothetical protein